MAERTMIDARGAFCPGPLMEVIAALKLIEIGDEMHYFCCPGCRSAFESQQGG